MTQMEAFLNKIKIDFSWSLYICEYFDEGLGSDPQRVLFPFCCQLASQLIASYLYVHFDKDTRVIRATQIGLEHYWCECGDVIIDYTDFQFSSEMTQPIKRRFMEFTWERDDFTHFVNQFPVVYTASSHSHKLAPGFEFVDCKLLCIDLAREYPLSSDAFLNYVSEALPLIQPQMRYY